MVVVAVAVAQVGLLQVTKDLVVQAVLVVIDLVASLDLDHFLVAGAVAMDDVDPTDVVVVVEEAAVAVVV